MAALPRAGASCYRGAMMIRLRHALTVCLMTFALLAGLTGASLLKSAMPSADDGAMLRSAAYLPVAADSLCSDDGDRAKDHRSCPACRLLSIAVMPAPAAVGRMAFGRIMPGPCAGPAVHAAAQPRDPVRSVRAPPAL